MSNIPSNLPVANPTPLLLQPLSWCGRQWKHLTQIDSAHRSCQIAVRIIPSVLLALATMLAGFIGVVGCFTSRPGPRITSTSLEISPLLKNRMRELGICEGSSSNIKQLLPRGIFYYISVSTIDIVHRTSRYVEKEGTCFIDLRVNERASFFLPLDRLADVFRGPAPSEVQGSDVIDFILGNKQSAKMKTATEQSIKTFWKISLSIPRNLDKMGLTVTSFSESPAKK